MHSRLLYAQSPEMAGLIRHADQLINSPDFQVVKAEGKTRAGFLQLPGGGARVFIKRTVTRSWMSGLFDLLRGSKAARALTGAKILRRNGFNCAVPLAAMDVRSSGVISASYLVSETLENAHILSHFALGRRGEARHGYARRKVVSDALATEVRRLHDAGIYTRDLQETNILVASSHGSLTFYFLDLEDFRSAGNVSHRRRMLNLVHLDRSIGRFVTRAGRLRFLYHYVGKGAGREPRRRAIIDFLKVRDAVERRRRRGA